MLAKLFKPNRWSSDLESQIYLSDFEFLDGKKGSVCISASKNVDSHSTVKSVEAALRGEDSAYEFVKDIEIPEDIKKYIQSFIYVKRFEEDRGYVTDAFRYRELFKK